DSTCGCRALSSFPTRPLFRSDHVLRIYQDTISWDYVEARHAFYLQLAENDLPFAVPEIFSVGAWVGHIYTVERRMPGQAFGQVLDRKSTRLNSSHVKISYAVF